MARKKKADPAQISLVDIIEEQTYTEEQKQFIEYKGKKSVVLLSTAGSGKTFSCVQRLKSLIKRGVDPKRIIFFSFTKAATEELKKRIANKDIRVTTIHAFCKWALHDMKKYRDVTNFFDFIEWYKKAYKPPRNADDVEKNMFNNNVSELYENNVLIASHISAYKLQKADGMKVKVPNYFMQYQKFQIENRKMDFSDMLIKVHDAFKDDRNLRKFKGRYDYIFIDEFQDTSTIQLKVLLKLNARYYYMIGDVNQAIYGYSGSNCDKLLKMVSERRETERMALTKNFRSDINIIENSNKYSSLKAIPNSVEAGDVNYDIMLSMEELINVLNEHDEVAVLVRTNKVIKDMELNLMCRRFPMNYTNYINEDDIESFEKKKKNGTKIPSWTQNKFNVLKDQGFSDEQEIVDFIKDNSGSKKHITTIHKSKGKEYDVCVVVNSIAPEILGDNGIVLPDKAKKKISFEYSDDDREEQNVHYVAVSRPRHKLYFMMRRI